MSNAAIDARTVQRAVQRATVERTIYLARVPVIVRQLRAERATYPAREVIA